MSRFDRLVKLIGNDNLVKLQNTSVLILGVGGVGGYVAESLVRSGISTLILVDFDIIDETNINRQIIALSSTIGKKKVDALKARIHDINPSCNVITYDIFYQEENKNLIFQNKIDYVVDACDTINSKKLIIKECLERNIPFISCTGTGNRLDPGKLYVTDIRKTDYDPLARILRKWVKDEKITAKIPVLCSREIPIKTGDRTPASSAFVPSAAGLMIASYIIQEQMKKDK